MFAVINANSPAEALTLEQAVRAYTQASAFAEHQEHQKAHWPWACSDLAVLSQDIFRVAPQALPATTSVLTIVGGRVVHDSRPVN